MEPNVTVSSLINLKLVLVLLHVVGTALGVGGASVTDFLFMRAIRKNRLAAQEFYLLTSISYVILAGLLILCCSGAGFLWIYQTSDQQLLQNPKLWAKITIVFFLGVNGWVMHKYLIESLKGLVGKPLLSTPFFDRLTLMFTCGTISAVSWYAAVFLGIWKEANFKFDYWMFVAGYLTISLLAIFAANILGRLAISHIRKPQFVPERRFEEAVKCSLTGLYNRRMAYELISKNIASAERSGGKFSLILFNIDHFHKINEKYDYFLADELLAQIAAFLASDLRDGDWLFRVGSDEFLMLLSNCDSDGAKNAASRVQNKIADIRFMMVGSYKDQSSGYKGMNITLSACAASVGSTDIGLSGGIESRSFGRLRLVEESSGKFLVNAAQDSEPLMAKTKNIMSQLTEGLAQGKQSGRNLVTLIEVKSNHLSVAV